MAGRRERRRPLIRSNSLAAVIARNGGTKRSEDPKNERQNGQTAPLKKTVTEQATTSLSQYAASTSQPELSQYLRQLSTLHTAGILTDEEFSAAQRRLFGS